MFSYPSFTISLWNVESWDLEYVILLKESNILLMIRIQNLSVTDIQNPVLGTQNPKRGI